MRVTDFRYDLPVELIAQYPPHERTASRLLCLDGRTGNIVDKIFNQLPELLEPGDVLVFNDTKVIPARLLGFKHTGGRIEVLVERIVDDHHVLAQTRSSKAPKAGTRLLLEEGVEVEVIGRRGELFELQFNDPRPVLTILKTVGRIPLPPYISRSVDEKDLERYQTVYAEKEGAVAAPTAGLHFDHALLDHIIAKSVDTAYVTLHVGAGTFQPLRVDKLVDHKMHSEYVEVPDETCQKVRAAQARGARVIAVGTTTVRSLEAASQTDHGVASFKGETDLFIVPGYEFKTVDAMITNFHLPESTLLMLVCAFGGYEHVMTAYRHAVQAKYRFFSYGDAMFIQGCYKK